MKVVNLVTIDYGGAYRAAVRISESINGEGVESSIILRTKMHLDSPAEEIFDHKYERFISKVKNVGNLFFSHHDIVIEKFGTDVTKYESVWNADIIILHWVNSFLSVRGIKKLEALGKPIIWVMHDMWVFTGGCHNDASCKRYKEGCGFCPQMLSEKERDRTYRALREKMKLLGKKKICYVSPSTWLADCASNSLLLKNEKIIRIPNPLPLNIFFPEERKMAREKLNLPINKKIVAFGAMKSTSDPNKGFSYLKEAIKRLDSSQYEVMIFGSNERDKEMEKFTKVYYMGIINQEHVLRSLYSAADVFVAPSMQENYPSTVLEAMACETPVAAFSVGGMTDLIIHKKNGYLASSKTADQLAEGIIFCAENSDKLGKCAGEYVRQNNSYEVIGAQYRCLCEKLEKEKKDGR